MTYIPDDHANIQVTPPLPPEETKPGSSLVVGASWLMVSKTVSFAITMLLPLLLVRRLTQTEYGYYKQLFLLLQSAGNLLPFGMNMSLFYFVPRAKSREEKGNIVCGVVIFYLITAGLAGGCLVLYPELLQEFFHSEPLAKLGRQIGLTFIPYLLSSLLEFVLVANGDTRLSALTIVFVNVARTLMIIGAAMVWGSIGAILWCMTILTTLQTLWLLSYVLRSFGKFWRSFRMDSLLSQLSYALPLGFAGLLWALQVDVDNYFVSHYFSAALFAIYSTGCFDVPLVGILGDSVGTVLIPRISSLQATGSISEIVSVVAKAMRGLALVYAPVYVFTSLAANQVITLLFRKEYLASVPIFRINLLMVLLGVVAVDPIIRAFKSERFWVLRMNIVLLAILCGALFVGIKQFGLIGAVSSVITIQYVARALIVWRVSRLLDVHWKDIGRLKDVGKTLLAAVAAGLCVFPLLEPVARWGAFASLASCGTIFTAIYGLLLVLFKVPTEDEIVWFWARVKELLKTRLPAFIPGR